MQLLSKVSQNTQLMVLVNMQGTIVSSSKWQGKSEAFSSNFKSRKHSRPTPSSESNLCRALHFQARTCFTLDIKMQFNRSAISCT